MPRFLLILSAFLCSVSLGAQNLVPADSVVARFNRQLYAFAQEKIHLQTDKNHYVSGETIWFRAFLVDALSHRPDTVSRYLYVELIDPADSVVARYQIVHREGVFSGRIPLEEGVPGGDYSLRAYTRYMTGGDEDYFFRKPIRISDPLAASVRTEARFTPNNSERRTNFDLSFHPVLGSGKSLPRMLTWRIDGRPEDILDPQSDSTFRVSFRSADPRRKNTLLVDYDQHRQYLEIPPPPEQFDVSFFPEGGHLIANRPSTVGFKALKPNGTPETVSVELFNQHGESLGTFPSLHQGIGLFRFHPIPGTTYYAECTNAAGHTRRFDLPAAREDAVALNVVSARERLAVQAVAGAQAAPQPYTLIIQSRGLVFHSVPVSGPNAPVWVDPASLVSGVNHFLLIDPQGRIVSERLVFILNDDQGKAEFDTDRPSYGRRAPVQAQLSLRDAYERPLTGRFSVAVTDDKDLPVDSTYTILSSLLLDSELRGRIDEPGYYFRPDDPAAREAADALMLTQGWRRYDVPALVRGVIARPTLGHEKYQQITGRVHRPLNERAIESTSVNAISVDFSYMEVVKTDADGRFALPPMEYPDSTRFVVQTYSKRGTNWAELVIDTPMVFPPLSLSFPAFSAPTKEAEQSYIYKADQNWTVENGMRSVYFDAIEVTARRKQGNWEYAWEGMSDIFGGGTLSWQEMEEKAIYDWADLTSHISGIEVKDHPENPGNRWPYHRGQPMAVMLNEIPFTGSTIDEISLYDISRLEVLKGGLAVMTVAGGTGGMGSAGGVLLLYIDYGSNERQREQVALNRKIIRLLGYQKPAEFYSPKYETAKERENMRKPDLRTTIYWNPDVRADAEGNASFDFYTADAITTYSVVIEGVSDNGFIVRTVEKIARE
jgi:hypothetical protein